MRIDNAPMDVFTKQTKLLKGLNIVLVLAGIRLQKGSSHIHMHGGKP